MSEPAQGEETLRLRVERLEFVDVEGELVVLDTRRSLYYSVNESGGRLWAALRAGTNRSELRQILMDTHGLSEEKATADLTTFLEQLDSAGLLDHFTSR